VIALYFRKNRKQAWERWEVYPGVQAPNPCPKHLYGLEWICQAFTVPYVIGEIWVVSGPDSSCLYAWHRMPVRPIGPLRTLWRGRAKALWPEYRLVKRGGRCQWEKRDLRQGELFK
jgi:hypothetical protein